jgi:hypothetical protein
VRQGKRAEVRAEHVEIVLRERDPGAERYRGGAGDRPRRRPGHQIGVGRPVEQNFVVVVGRDLRAEAPPVERIQCALDQRTVDVALQEPPLILGEKAFAVERVRKRGEAPARDPGDEIDLVEHPPGPAGYPDLGPAQLLEDAVREGGRPRTTARERQDEECRRVVVRPRGRGAPAIAAVRIDPVQRLVHGTNRAAREQQAEHRSGESEVASVHSTLRESL